MSSIVNMGVKESMSQQKIRSIKLTNITAITMMIVGLLFLIPSIYENGWNFSADLVLMAIALFGVALWLNKKELNNFSRLIISIIPSFVACLASILEKMNQPENVVVYDFLDARIIITGFFVIPFFLFSYKERALLLSALSIPVFIVLGFDLIHNFFGVGFATFFGPMPKAYIVSGIYIDMVLLFAAGAVYYFKANIESLLGKKYRLTDDLKKKNIELRALFEKVDQSAEGLKRNAIVIKEQKNQLEKSNFKLAEEVEKKTVELRQSNEELIRHNNELQQFSNTLSHNLRGPVANLLGLAQLFKIDKTEENRTKVADHIFKSAVSLDGVIKDLNKIVELRNNLFQIKEKIEIRVEIDDIWAVLEPSIKQCNGILLLNIEALVIYGVRSYFHSIMYNLLSNAIKYRHQNRDCLIRVDTKKTEGDIIIIIQDNGIGIDLNKHGDQIFGMYKRFHDHLEGKGLGLFLTKQQVEGMKGTISVESDLNVGTRFTIKLPSIPLSQIESQLFYKSKVADIYLDTVNNITTLLWKKMPNPFEFQEVFTNNIEVFSSYNSAHWIIDLSLMVNRTQLEKQWILDEAIDQYVKVGIEKIAIVRRYVDDDKAFWDEFISITTSKAVEVVFVDSSQEAKDILLKA